MRPRYRRSSIGRAPAPGDAGRRGTPPNGTTDPSGNRRTTEDPLARDRDGPFGWAAGRAPLGAARYAPLGRYGPASRNCRALGALRARAVAAGERRAQAGERASAGRIGPRSEGARAYRCPARPRDLDRE